MFSMFKKKPVVVKEVIAPDVAYQSGAFLQQGDVLLHCEPIPPDAQTVRSRNKHVLVKGEHTGHAHRLNDDGNFMIFENPKTKTRYLRLLEPCALRHEEHKEQKLPPGDYRIDQVREVDNFDEARKVRKHID